MNKVCPQKGKYAGHPDYICNPATGKWVKKSGPTGKSLMEDVTYYSPEVKKGAESMPLTDNCQLLIDILNLNTPTLQPYKKHQITMKLTKEHSPLWKSSGFVISFNMIKDGAGYYGKDGSVEVKSMSNRDLKNTETEIKKIFEQLLSSYWGNVSDK